MNVGIDARYLAGNRTGIGRYILEIARLLPQFLPSASFFAYTKRPLDCGILPEPWTVRLEPSRLAREIPGEPWLKLRAGSLIARDGLDVFWATTGFLPELHHGVRTICTAYDVNFKIVPHTMPHFHRWLYKLFLQRDLSRADRLTVISHGTADRLGEHLALHAHAILLPGVADWIQPVDRRTASGILQRVGVKSPYILSVATREPRKNLASLITAFLELKREGQLPYHKLVLAGNVGWDDDKRWKEWALSKHIQMLGYVPDEILPSLYSSCDAFVFPSVYEGYGLPVAEARACGAFVVATDIPELREAGGPEAVYIEATEKAIKGALLTVGSQPRQLSLHRPSRWSDAASGLAHLIEELSGARPEAARRL